MKVRRNAERTRSDVGRLWGVEAGKVCCNTQTLSLPYMERGTKKILLNKLPMLPLCVLTFFAACVCILLFVCLCAEVLVCGSVIV